METGTWLSALAVVAAALLAAVPGIWSLMAGSRQRGATAYETMERTLASLSARMEQAEQQRLRDHQLILAQSAKIQLQDAKIQQLSDIVRRLIEQIEGLGAAPVVRPTAEELEPVTVDVVKLGSQLRRHFSAEELADLALRTGIDMEDVGGQTLTARVNALVKTAEQRGLLSELAARAKALRPNVKKWD